MLRCVRLNIELLASRIQDPAEFFRGGISIEMTWLLVNSSWILHISCKKRRVAPIAALLSSVLHQSTFGDQLMHKSDDGPGPMKWFVEKILEEGTKSPRTIRLAALHLCGLWLAYPNTLQYYIKELKLLTSYGSAELAENHDARAEVSVSSRSLDPELTDVFINTELYARISVAVMFSKLADIAYSDKCTSRNEDKCAIISSGKLFLLELLSSVVNEKISLRSCTKSIVRFIDGNLHTSIQRNNLPSVRQYMETLAIYIYLKFPSLALSSYIFIAANVILHGKKIQSGLLAELLPPIVPLLTFHHHTLRGFTQILLYDVLEKMFPDSNPAACSSMSLEGRCFVDLRYYLDHNSDCTRLRASQCCQIVARVARVGTITAPKWVG
ncbi:tRNA (guanosine(18)-2'-O)-methyltransferase [Salvia divinorum]|uniref:tRNA (Guanosine(18)-2'-O)-methyltransferase n=1 Tax=Salvia divinorum TaxID=28513 RepID=A0ABD1FY56_SALDI